MKERVPSEDAALRRGIEYSYSGLIRDLRELYEKKGIPAHMASYAAVNILHRYLMKRSEVLSDAFFDLDWLEKILAEDAQRKQSTKDRSWLIGLLVEGLIQYGCSRNQAQDAVSSWLSISKTTVKNAQILLRGKNEIFFASVEEYADNPHLLVQKKLREFIKGVKKPFPARYKKALKAYEAFKAAVVDAELK